MNLNETCNNLMISLLVHQIPTPRFVPHILEIKFRTQKIKYLTQFLFFLNKFISQRLRYTHENNKYFYLLRNEPLLYF
ncbi:hypothetical protein pb186bvf_014185 [Paramecium bursaria]